MGIVDARHFTLSAGRECGVRGGWAVTGDMSCWRQAAGKINAGARGDGARIS